MRRPESSSSGLSRARASFRTLLGLAFLPLAAGLGCAGRAPIPAWQETVDRYIAERGNGDPHVLRLAGHTPDTFVDRPDLITLNALDIPAPGWPPGQKYDVFGVLLGVQPLDGGLCYPFVIAVVHCPPPTAGRPVPPDEFWDLRIAALCVRPSGSSWRISEADDEALQRYIEGRRPTDRVARPLFPAPGDRFELTRAGDELVVTERRSGARLRLSLEPRRER